MGATLIIGPAWVGDMVMAQSLFRLLKSQDPAQQIDVIGPAWSVPLVGRMPEVRRGIPLAIGHGELALGARRELGHALRGECYARAIVLPRSFKSALVPWFAGIPVRTGFGAEFRGLLLTDARRLDRKVLDQTVKRFLALGGKIADLLVHYQLDMAEQIPGTIFCRVTNPGTEISIDPATRGKLGQVLDGIAMIAHIIAKGAHGLHRHGQPVGFGQHFGAGAHRLASRLRAAVS